jgi:heme A synthase
MKAESNLSRFSKYAWFVLGYNLIVILWGAFLRASLSGDGCGQHWLTCNGEVIPTAPQFKTIIEFSHRLSTGLAFIFVLVLFVWAVAKIAKPSQVRKAAFASFIFIVVEALIGAGLVLTGNTAENLTATRPLWTAAHLVTTFSLLAALVLTAWLAGGKSFSFRNASNKFLLLLGIAVLGFLAVGMSGSVAALSSMLFPSASVSEGLAKDFSAASHYLLRLRVSHPILSISLGVYLVFLAGWLKFKMKDNNSIKRLADFLTLIVLIQLASGALTFFLLAPVLMQLLHLLLADLLWIVFVLFAVSVLAQKNDYENLSKEMF